MALKVGNKMLLNHLSTGDASSNESYYNVKCNKSLWNQCIKIEKESSSRNTEIKWIWMQAYESIVSFVLEQEAIESVFTYVTKDFNELYIKNVMSFPSDFSIVYQT